MPVLNNRMPGATAEITAKRSLLADWHRTRYYGKAGEPDLVEWLTREVARLADLGADAKANRTPEDVAYFRAAWQYARGWLRDAQDGRGARHVSGLGSISADEAWSTTARVHADVATCTGGTSAPHQIGRVSLLDVPAAQRCGSEVCAPAYARADAVARTDIS